MGAGRLGSMAFQNFKKYKNTIFCTDNKDHPFTWHGTWKDVLKTYSFNFEPATKEEYKGQNKPKFKVGEWAYWKSCGHKYLFKFDLVDHNNVVIASERYCIRKNGQVREQDMISKHLGRLSNVFKKS